MFLLIFAFILCLLPSNIQGSLSCEEQLYASDNCLKKILYIGDWNLTFLRTNNDIEKHCNETKKNFACLRRYARCIHNIPREIFNVFMKNSRKLYKERCETLSGRKEFLSHMKCLDEKSISVNKCMDKLIEILYYISENEEHNKILKASCCGIKLGIGCFKEKINSYCEKKIGAPTTEYFSNKLNTMLSEVSDMTCSNYKDIKACDEEMPELMVNLRSILEGEVEKKSTSLLLPLMSIANKIKF